VLLVLQLGEGAVDLGARRLAGLDRRELAEPLLDGLRRKRARRRQHKGAGRVVVKRTAQCRQWHGRGRAGYGEAGPYLAVDAQHRACREGVGRGARDVRWPDHLGQERRGSCSRLLLFEDEGLGGLVKDEDLERRGRVDGQQRLLVEAELLLAGGRRPGALGGGRERGRRAMRVRRQAWPVRGGGLLRKAPAEARVLEAHLPPEAPVERPDRLQSRRGENVSLRRGLRSVRGRAQVEQTLTRWFVEWAREALHSESTR